MAWNAKRYLAAAAERVDSAKANLSTDECGAENLGTILADLNALKAEIWRIHDNILKGGRT